MIKAVLFDFYGVLNIGMEPNHELLSLIENDLKPKYKLGIISNAEDEFMFQIVPQKTLSKLFDDIVISYKVGVAKPDPKIFQISLANLGVNPSEAVFIDDISRFCDSAEKLGIRTIRYENFGQVNAELEKILAA